MLKLRTSLGTDQIVDKTSVVKGLTYNSDAYNVALPHFLNLLASDEWHNFCQEVRGHLAAVTATSDPFYGAAAAAFNTADFEAQEAAASVALAASSRKPPKREKTRAGAPSKKLKTSVEEEVVVVKKSKQPATLDLRRVQRDFSEEEEGEEEEEEEEEEED